MSNKRNMVIFTDLDGTLLDRDTYSYSGAEGALDVMRSRNIPLVLASSKTRAEVELYRSLLHNEHPFIVENGAAAFIPIGYFDSISPALRRVGKYFVKEVGLPYTAIRKALVEVRRLTGLSIKGFGDLSAEEVAKISGLDLKQARLSLMREYSEPFVIAAPLVAGDLELIHEVVKQLDLKLTIGQKFFHLTGPHDKGGLVRELISLFRKALGNGAGRLVVVGLGDGKNDIEMLIECDFPILIKKKNGTPDDEVIRNVPNVSVHEAGPAGWNSAVIELLHDQLSS